jgi:hypothetical protein
MVALMCACGRVDEGKDMLVTSVQQRTALDGTSVVEAVLHLSAEQAGACSDAVRAAIAGRYRVPALTVDEILTMREMTALADGLDDCRNCDGLSIFVLNILRLGLLRDSLGDGRYADVLADLYADAVRLALEAPVPTLH